MICWDDIADDQLVKALSLMIKPEWLKERNVAISILENVGYNASDASEVLGDGKPLHDGPMMDFQRL